MAERSGLDVDALLANWRRTDAAGRLLDAAREQRRSREAEWEQPASLVAGPLEVGAGEADRIGVPTAVLSQLREIGDRLDDASLGTRISARATGPGRGAGPAGTSDPGRSRRPVPGRRKAASPDGRPGWVVGDDQVSCRMTITKMMTTSTPMMVPISPLFIPSSSLAPDPSPRVRVRRAFGRSRVYIVNTMLWQGSQRNIAFQVEQRALSPQATDISAERAIGAQHPVAGHDTGTGLVAHAEPTARTARGRPAAAATTV